MKKTVKVVKATKPKTVKPAKMIDVKTIVQQYNEKVLQDHEDIYRINEIKINAATVRQRVRESDPPSHDEYADFLTELLKSHKVTIPDFEKMVEKEGLSLMLGHRDPVLQPVVTNDNFNMLFKQPGDMRTLLFKISLLLDNVAKELSSQCKWHRRLAEYVKNIDATSSEDLSCLYLPDGNYDNQLMGGATLIEYIKCYEDLRIGFAFEDVFGGRYLYKKSVTLTENGMTNIMRFLDIEDAEEEIGTEIFIVLINDVIEDDCYVTETHSQTIDVAKMFFHSPTLEYIDNLQYTNFAKFDVLMKTFKEWLNKHVPLVDHDRYLIAGGAVKAAYGIRESSDIDFFISDTEDKIEDAADRRYTPNILVKGIYDDFGKTHYAVENYYFPARNEIYAKQAEYKAAITKSGVEKTLLDIVPPFSVSGLKAGRYINFYKQMSAQFSDAFGTLDDLVFHPAHFIYVNGLKVAKLEYEVLRDHMRCLDLDRVSVKQTYDFCEINRLYNAIYPQEWFDKLGIARYKFDDPDFHPRMVVKMEVQLYHGEPFMNGEGDPIGEKVLIRRAPLFLNERLSGHPFIAVSPVITKELATFTIAAGKSYVVWHLPDKSSIVNQRIYENVLLTSLPVKVNTTYQREPNLSYWNYILTDSGKIHVALITNNLDYGSKHEVLASIVGEPIIAGGQLNVTTMSSTTVKILFNVRSAFTDVILSKVESAENKRKYEMKMVNMVRSIINIHKLYDMLCNTNLSIECVKDAFNLKNMPEISKREMSKNNVFTSDDDDKIRLMKGDMCIPHSMFCETYGA